MSELEATPLERGHVAQQAHEMALHRERLATLAGRPIEAALWHSIRRACVDELCECIVMLRALKDSAAAVAAPAANDGILRGNADLVTESAIYSAEGA